MGRSIGLSLAFLAIALWLVGGCQASRNRGEVEQLSQAEALQLAVALANEECSAKYSGTPFDESTYPIEFDGERWHWGGYDPAGLGGYSAEVSFDAAGNNREVQVYLSVDQVTPTGREVEPRDE
jgi:hypothetical protein